MKLLVDVPGGTSGLGTKLQQTTEVRNRLCHPAGRNGPAARSPPVRDVEVLFVPSANELRRPARLKVDPIGLDQLHAAARARPTGARNSRALNCRGCFDVPIAEVEYIAMMVNLARATRGEDDPVRTRPSGIAAGCSNQEIRGMTVGLCGATYGGIGHETASWQLGLRVRVDAMERRESRRENIFCRTRHQRQRACCPTGCFRAGEGDEFRRFLDFLAIRTAPPL